MSIRHNGSLAHVPTGWLFLGVLLSASVLLAAVWPKPWAPALFHGAVASLGVVIWIAAAAVCLFTALVAHAGQAERSRILFFLTAGLLTLWLGLDDFFRIREDVLPRLGASKAVMDAAYVAMAVAYLAAFWRPVRAGRPFLLVAAGVAFAASMSLDAFVPGEALRFLGIAFWAGFHVAAAATTAEELVTGRVTTVAVSSARLVRRLT